MWAGVVTAMVVADSTVKGIGVPPRFTRVAPAKPTPVRMTRVPPPSGPAVVDRELTAGAVAWKAKRARVVALEVPPAS